MQINFIKPDDNKTLDQIKSDKVSELDTLCNKSILGTFTYQYTDGNTYSFYNDMTAQANFDKVLNAFNQNMITSIPWTAYDSNGVVSRITFDLTNFIDLYKAHLNHIQSNISRFRDYLQPQVVNATTKDQVKAIVW